VPDSPPPQPLPSPEPAAPFALSRRRLGLGLLLATVLALAFLAQPLWNWDRSGSTDDWRWFTFHWQVSRTTLLDYHQLPVWNPYHCGGNVHLANPQTQYLSPLAWPGIALGPTLGLKLFVFLHLVLGWLAMAWLARDLALGPWATALAASLFVVGGYFFQHLGGGHSSFLPFFLFPAALAAFRRSLADLRYVALSAALLALMVLEGGVYPAPYAALLLGVYALGRSIQGRGALRPLAVLALTGALAFALAGVKLLPVMAFLREHPRVVPSDDGMGLVEVLMAFASRRLERRFEGHLYVWPEYGAYMGIPVLLAVGWLAWRRPPRWRGWLLGLGFFAVLMTGNRGGGFSPHELLHELPLFKSLHVPSRFGGVVTLFLALLAAAAAQAAWHALDRVRARPGLRRALRALLVLVAVAAVLDSLTFGQWQMGRFKDAPPQGPARASFGIVKAHWNGGPGHPQRRMGVLACYEPNGVPRGKVRAGLPQEAFLAKGATGSLAIVDWSPARVAVQVELDAPGLVVLNQNDHRGWQVEGGARASHDGMPAASLGAPGAQRVVFRYRPPGLLPGLGLTLGGLLALAGLLWLGPARQRALGARLEWLWSGRGLQ